MIKENQTEPLEETKIGAPNPPPCSLFSHHTQSVFLMAARYAHRRKTGASFMAVNAIKENWHNLAAATQNQIKREAEREATHNPEDWAVLENLEVNASA